MDNDVWGLLEDSKKRIVAGHLFRGEYYYPGQKIAQLKVNDPELKNERDAIIQTGPEQFVLCGPGSGLSLIDESKHSLEKIGLKRDLPSHQSPEYYSGQQRTNSGSDRWMPV